MLESNISGLFGMSSNNDNDSDHDFGNRNDYKSRQQRQRKHYIESGYKTKMGIDLDIDTGEILNFVPKTLKKMGYNNRRNYGSQGMSMPDLSKLLPLVMYGAIGLVGYKIYNKFFGQTEQEKIETQAAVTVGKAYVDTAASKVQTSNAAAASLAKVGVNVNTQHKQLADYLHDLLDVSVVNDSKVVATIQGMQLPTFILVSNAYGVRSLPEYCSSMVHIFTNGFMLRNALDGTLKFQLMKILDSSDQSKISKYLSAV